MKRVGLILLFALLGCGPKRVSVAPPAAATDTLTVVYLGNLEDYLLSDSGGWLAALSGFGSGKSMVIARFEPTPGLTAEWYGRLGLGEFLNRVYSGTVIVPKDFFRAAAGNQRFSVLEPAAGSIVRNYRFARVGFITAPDFGAADSVYFEYRRNRSILRARSEIIVTFSLGPDLASDTAVNFSLAGGRRIGNVLVVDRTVKTFQAGDSEQMNQSVDEQTQKELMSFRVRMNALRAETLFVFGSSKASSHAEFKKYIAGQVRTFFAAEMAAIPTSVFWTELSRGRRVFTVDSVAKYLDGDVRLGVETIPGQEAKALAKDENLIVMGRPKEETTAARSAPNGIRLFDILSHLTNRR